VQNRAQRELDAVLGSPESPSFRLPTFSDRLNLPYIDAIVKEGLRYIPPVTAGLPHAVIQDDVYRGWLIPKGSIVIANAWGMLRDPSIYPDPEIFRPERFLPENSKTPEADPGSSGAFGFGKRVCPGRLLAENSVWIMVASLLACFHLEHKKDENGKDINIDYAASPLPEFIA